MKPTLCSRCKKNVAVVFITRLDNNGQGSHNEGLCLKCAAQLGLPQVEDMMKRMGITPDDLENLNSEMMQAFGGAEELGDVAQANEDGDEDEESGKTATFPFLNRLFGGNNNPPAEKGETPQRETGKESRKGEKKHKYLDNYCINLSRRAREGKLDAVIGREEEIQRVVQILNRRQKNNPCLIGEPGVGKTAIAEGLARKIAKENDLWESTLRTMVCLEVLESFGLVTIQKGEGGTLHIRLRKRREGGKLAFYQSPIIQRLQTIAWGEGGRSSPRS